MTEFERINGNRREKILVTLDLIETSANSNRATPEEIAAFLGPVMTRLPDLAPVVIQHAESPALVPTEPTEIEATPPVQNEAGNLAGLSTQQLVDRMIACGAILAKRRK